MVVRFKAVGNAPIMKQNLYKITASARFQAIIQFLRQRLGWTAGDPLVRSISPLCAYSVCEMLTTCCAGLGLIAPVAVLVSTACYTIVLALWM